MNHEEFDETIGCFRHACGILTSWFRYDDESEEWVALEWAIFDPKSQQRIMEIINSKEKEKPLKTIEVSYAIWTAKGYFATQGNTYWFQERPTGWALFTTEEEAIGTGEHHHSAIGTKPEEGYKIEKITKKPNK